MVVFVCHDSIFGRRSVCQSFLRSRAAPTRPKSEKPRKSREGKRIKRLKRQQPERKEKYRKRQCRANHEQHHQLSKLSATHDVRHQRGGKNFQGGASRCPNPTPRGNDAIQIVFRIRSRWVSGYLGRNNSAIAPNPALPASPPGALWPTGVMMSSLVAICRPSTLPAIRWRIPSRSEC